MSQNVRQLRPESEVVAEEPTSSLQKNIEEKLQSNSENIFALIIALTTCFYALANAYNGRAWGNVTTLYTDKANAYQWFQSKGVREYLSNHQIEYLELQKKTSVLSPESLRLYETELNSLHAAVSKIKKEKAEILLGSSVVGEANWAQELNGKMGIIFGAKQIEADIDKYNRAWSYFEQAGIMLQMCLGFAAIGLVVKSSRLKFFSIAIIFSLIGISLWQFLIGYSIYS